MAKETLEQCFARFRATADPAALAAVFDRTAPELLRLATHLTRDVHRAEDLVQATFIVAIEDTAALPADMPVLPWLIGVLANRARRLNRELLRFPDPERLAQRGEPGPEAHATSAELSEALATAIAQLSEPYRPVLTLHLQHGLAAHEIADALGRPAGTVRTQLVRGLDLVRRALPVGFAVGVLAVATPGRGLAAVRTHVLAHVPAPMAIAAPVLSGVMLMSAKAWALCGALLLLPALWLLWPGSAAPSPGAPLAVEATRGEATSRPVAATADSGAADSRRTLVQATPPAPRAASDPGQGSLAIHVVWGEDLTPAVGVGVRVRPWSGMFLLDREATTDELGTALVRDLAPGMASVSVDRAGSQDVDVVADAATRVALSIPAGVTVQGLVLDTGDQPVAEAAVWLSGQTEDDGQICTRTGSDGRFQLRAVAPGRVLSAHAAGRVPGRFERVDGTPGSSKQVTLRLGPAGGILRGRVLDPSRQPIAGASIQVGDCLPNGKAMVVGSLGIVGAAPLRTRTGAEGSFLVAGAPVGGDHAGRAVRVFAGAHGFASWQGVVDGAAAQPPELLIVLARGAAVNGRVADPVGRPIAGVLVMAGSGSTSTAEPAWMRRSTSTASDGSFALGGLSAGAIEMYAQTRSGAHVRETVLAAEGGTARWDPILGGGRRIQGRLVDERGSPLPGWMVGSGPVGQLAGRIERTDAAGAFTITDCAEGPHRLEVHEPGTRGLTPVLIRDGIVPDRDPVVLEVSETSRSSAFLAGTLVGADGRPATSLPVTMVRIGVSPLFDATTDGQGRFRFGPFPPARYRVMLNASPACPQTELGEHELTPNHTLDLGTIRLPACGFANALVARDDGAPAGGHCMILDPQGAMVAGGALVEGHCRAGPLKPGSYVLAIPWDARSAPCRKAFEITEGRDTQIALTVRGGVVRKVRLRSATDQTKDVRLAWFDAGGGVLWQEVLSAREVMLERAFVPGDYRVEARVGEQVRTTTFTVGPAAASTDEIVIAHPRT
jgi:RNA polymerase sigma factor (sigma-70 family)